MIYRSVHMIFETSGQPVPTEEEVEFEANELLQRSGWGVPLIERLRKIADPYWREALARCLMERWRELVRDKNEQTYYYDMDGDLRYCWEDADYDFGRVIRASTNEQAEAEMALPSTTDPNAQIKADNDKLRYENYQLKKQLETMAENEPKHQTTVYNIYGTYNDIHDNPNATIYTAPQDAAKTALMPKEGDYSALVKWLETEKANGNDYYADADYNRSQMCRNLLKIIGWEPNQDSLRKAQGR